MFQEAVSAIQSGDRSRARDLLTRLLKTTQNQPEYWVWMSAVVDTAKERVYCLQQALQLDPQNAAARRGLSMAGQLPVDERLVVPARLQKRSWQAGALAAEREPSAGMPPAVQMALMGAGAVVVVGLLLFFVFGSLLKPSGAAATQPAARRWPTETPAPSQTVVAASNIQAAAVTAQPTPITLDATYTPTAVYWLTPHPASVAESFKYGLRAYSRGEWASAENLIKQVLTTEPHALDARYIIADVYRQQGKLTQALNAFNDLIKTDPEFAPAYLGRARTRLAADRAAGAAAAADLEQAIAVDPAFGEAYLELARLLMQGKQYEKAGPVLEQAGQVLPESPLVFLYQAELDMALGDYVQALAHARRAQQLDQTLLPAYLFIGEALHMTGDLEGSRKALDVYITYVKDDPRAWLWTGMAHQSAGDGQKARQAFDQALRLNNHLPEAYLYRARLLMSEDQAEKALEDYRAALRLDDASFEASMGVGQALMAMKYPGDAYMQFERSQALAKTGRQKSELTYWRALSLEELGELQVALREWKKLLEMPEDDLAEGWAAYAGQRVQALATSTPTPRPATATATLRPTDTRVPTRTVPASATPRPTNTPTATNTPRATSTR